MKKKFLLTLCALFLSNVTYPYCDSWRDPDTNLFWYFVRTSENTASLHKDDNDSEDIYPCVSLTHPTDVTIPTIVYYNDNAYTVTGIDDSAFADDSFLRSITIPNSVVSISGNVFANCHSLSSIIVNEGNPTYDSRDGCNAIIETASNTLIAGCKSTIIPESVTSIGSGAFSTCGTDLTSITIPNSVTRILSSAFYPCSGLTIVKAMSPTPAVTNWAFSYNTTSNGTLYVPIGSKSAYESATGWNEFSNIIEIIFFDDASVKSICVANWDTDGDGELSKTEAAAVTSLGEVFKNNMTITSFNELQYFTGLTEINDHAFRNTIALTSVIIPENVTRIGNDAFGRWTEGTSNLVSVQLPDGLIEIGEDAFWSCNKLKNINIPTNLRSIGDGAFHYTAIESLILPEGFLSIGNGACNYCNSLESIYIPSTVTHIVDGSVDCTFGGCEVLHSIVVAENNPVYDSRNNCNALIESSTNRLIRGSNQTIIPSGIVSIERQAFDFSNISQINIPSTVTTMCDYAFGGCQYLKMVKVNSETPITITSDVFSSDFRGGSNIHSITLYVPNGCKAAYEAADCWNEFKEIIETNTVNVGSTGFATYCSPNALDFSGVSGIKAYVASDFDSGTNTLTLTRVTEVPAGEGLYIVGTAGSYEIPETTTDAVYSNLMKGVTRATTISPTDGSNTNLILSNGSHGVGFYTLSAEGELAGGKAYLQLPTASVAGVKALNLVFDDDATGIDFNPVLSKEERVIYNIAGQRVSKAQKGLYIIDGKKVFIK